MAKTIEIFVGRELPAWDLHWLDTDGDPDPFGAGSWTYAVTIRQGSTDTALSGATVTANANPTLESASPRVATLTVAPAAASLDSLITGKATIIVVATSGGKDREGQWPAVVNT